VRDDRDVTQVHLIFPELECGGDIVKTTPCCNAASQRLPRFERLAQQL